MTRLAPEVTRVIARLCDEINFDRPESDEALELTAAYVALQDAGLHPSEAADVVSEVRVGASGTDEDCRGDDASLDAIAVLVGDACVTPKTDREVLRRLLAEAHGRRIEFLLVQATGVDPSLPTTPAVKDKLNGFLVGIQMFLNIDKNAGGLNARVKSWLGFRDEILALMRELSLPQDSVGLRARLVWPRAIRLEDLHLNSIEAARVGAAHMLSADSGRCRIEVWNIDEFTGRASRALAPRMIAIPSSQLFETAPGRSQHVRSYGGCVGARELIRAARVSGRPDARLDPGLFVDNVRANLGPDTDVNREIMETLATAEGRASFHLMSNGVALLSRTERRNMESGSIELVGVQIINGCQTTHALHAAAELHGDAILDEIVVPVRIVITEDDALIDRIIFGLNRQQPIEAMHLLSRRPYVLRLGAVFKEIAGPGERCMLYFARRAGEHAAVAERHRVVTIHDVLFAFQSAFGTAPHADMRSGRLLEGVRKERLFQVHQPPAFYVAGALMLSALLRELARRGNLDSQGRWAGRSQALYAMRLLAERQIGATMPFEQKGERGQAYISSLLPQLCDPIQAQKLASRAIDIVVETALTAEHVAGKSKGRKLDGPLSAKVSLERFTQVLRSIVER